MLKRYNIKLKVFFSLRNREVYKRLTFNTFIIEISQAFAIGAKFLFLKAKLRCAIKSIVHSKSIESVKRQLIGLYFGIEYEHTTTK